MTTRKIKVAIDQRRHDAADGGATYYRAQTMHYRAPTRGDCNPTYGTGATIAQAVEDLSKTLSGQHGLENFTIVVVGWALS